MSPSPTRGSLHPGHDQRVSLSPVSAISDMVAPVVLITLATIFANFAFAALALVLAGVVGEFAGIATVIIPLARSADPVVELTKRTGVLD